MYSLYVDVCDQTIQPKCGPNCMGKVFSDFIYFNTSCAIRVIKTNEQYLCSVVSKASLVFIKYYLFLTDQLRNLNTMKLLKSLMNEMNMYQRHFNIVMYLACDFLYYAAYHGKKHDTGGKHVNFGRIEKHIVARYDFLSSIISHHLENVIDTLLDEGIMTKGACNQFLLYNERGVYSQCNRHSLATLAYEVFRIAENYVTAFRVAFSGRNF